MIMDIFESNKLIAEFLGIPKYKRCTDCEAYQYGPAVIFHPKEMQYHEKWDWLMPVCAKLDSLRVDPPHNNKYVELSDELDLIVAFYEISPLYNQVIKMIVWYNENILA